MKSFITIFSILLLSGTIHSSTGGSPTVITHVRVFDGFRVIPANTVIIENGRIKAVGTDLPIPESSTVIDGRGGTLLPGFIDAHTHVFGNVLTDALMFGVTTELDMGTDFHLVQKLKKEQSGQPPPMRADIFSAGTLVTAPGGHGTEYGLPIPTLARKEDAEAFVRERIREGSDYIKIVYDDGHGFGFQYPTLDFPTLKAVIRAAHKFHRLAVVHIGDYRAAREAIEAGADGIVHLFADRLPDPDFASWMARKGAFVIPTLTVIQSALGIRTGKSLLADPYLKPYLAPINRAALKQVLSWEFQPNRQKRYETVVIPIVKQLKKAGVPILAGTDASNPGTAHGASLHRELELLVEAGLTPIEALRAATSLPARIFQLTDRGRIKPGLKADLILVDGDPTRVITDTRKIRMIWKHGRPVDRDGYRQKIEKAVSVLEKLKQTPPPPHSESGWVSHFDNGQPDAFFGRWIVSTDAIMQGRSTARFRVVKGGAAGTPFALEISGNIQKGSVYPWAGAMFLPSGNYFQPANLSRMRGFEFYARGNVDEALVMLFASSLGFRPTIRLVHLTPKWQKMTFDFEDFGVEGYDLIGVFIGRGLKPGPFTIFIDEFRFLPGKPAPPSNPIIIRPEQPFTLAIGQRALLKEPDELEMVLQKVEDSRCPRGARCVWAGEAVVTLSVHRLSQPPVTLRLTLGTDPQKREHPIGRFSLRLLDVSPYPEVKKTIDPTAYRATFILRVH